MKRTFKILAYFVLIVVLLIGVAGAVIYARGIPKYKAEIPPAIAGLQVPRDSAHVDRGAKIASLMCNACHKNQETGRLTGQVLVDMPKEFGRVASFNITQDPEHGIGKWTDGELYYFLRTGIRTDGSWAPPYMPKFPLMADEDVYSIIAWLRSDDPVLQSDPKEYPPNKPNLLVRFLANVAIFPPPLPEKPIVIPDSTDRLAFGKYVADALCNCYGCHSADFAKQNDIVPEKSLGYYGGGNPMLNMEGETVPSANITMDKTTGIGNWTRESFLRAVKYGQHPLGRPINYPMFPHTTLTDTEVNAIFDYLQTVPPIQNAVARYQPG